MRQEAGRSVGGWSVITEDPNILACGGGVWIQVVAMIDERKSTTVVKYGS